MAVLAATTDHCRRLSRAHCGDLELGARRSCLAAACKRHWLAYERGGEEGSRRRPFLGLVRSGRRRRLRPAALAAQGSGQETFLAATPHRLPLPALPYLSVARCIAHEARDGHDSDRLFSNLSAPRGVSALSCDARYSGANTRSFAVASPPPPMPSRVHPQLQTQPRALRTRGSLRDPHERSTTRALFPHLPVSPEVPCTTPTPTTAFLLDRRRASSYAPCLPCSHPRPAAHSLPFLRVSPRVTRSSTSPASIRPGVGRLHSRSSPSRLPLRMLCIG
jgi:hypothetical protein